MNKQEAEEKEKDGNVDGDQSINGDDEEAYQ